MIKRLLRSNIRFKLVISLLSIVVLAGTLSIFIGLNVINTNIIREAYDAVRTSLAATNELYQEEIENRSRIIRYLAKMPEIVRATTGKDRAFLFEKLVQIKQEFEFDIVNVVNTDGTTLVRANNFEAFGDSMAGYRTIQDVQKTHAPSAGTGIIGFANIAGEGREVADRTLIKVIPTSQLRPPPSPLEDRAMVIKIAAPILSGEKLEGILYAAILLNNNAGFIDRFKRLVFKEEKINGRDVGTTTLFLGDIRVATNVVDSAGRRAIGTQVSDEVYERVIVKGQEWLGEALVVGHWYISGYSPIYDFDHRILGMLYNGVLKEKFDLIVRNTTISFLLVILVTTILALAI
jgi:two-component system NtrC family sensor kinase